MSSLFTPPEADQEIAPPSAFELLWLNHRGAFLGSIAGMVALVVIVLGMLASSRSSRIASETLSGRCEGMLFSQKIVVDDPRVE